MYKYIVLMLLFVNVISATINNDLNDWIIQQGKNINVGDKKFISFINEIVPDDWVEEVVDRFSNGHTIHIIENRCVFIDACKYHYCPAKVVFWYDTKLKSGLVVIVNDEYPRDRKSTLIYLSDCMLQSEIPVLFIKELNSFLSKEGIQNVDVKYIMRKIDKKNTASISALKDAHQKALGLYKSGSKKEAAWQLYNAIGTKPWVITKDNVTIFNDLGYFLEQTGYFTNAVDILTAVIKYNPERTVAYLNIADAYYDLNDTVNGKTAYQKYIDLMKKEGKEKKIPQRVFDRVK